MNASLRWFGNTWIKVACVLNALIVVWVWTGIGPYNVIFEVPGIAVLVLEAALFAPGLLALFLSSGRQRQS